ncbi:hypothetical protein LMG27198_46230 [Methylocystis echinoides]|uniref:EF-hand domain-containing protein n=1 Tax=Methylocystis echinoides TaxID=29468 RepID=A0A9W6LUK3_9HYPH|nr:hypothetical protein LMG27198_46230 [Methylocystis echinoides]
MVLAGAVALSGVLVAPLSPALAKKRPKASPVATLDTDNGSTVDLNELNKAAKELFGKLERGNDGTLDKKQLQGRLGKESFAAADPNRTDADEGRVPFGGLRPLQGRRPGQ